MTKSQQDTLKTIAQLLALVVIVAGIAFAAGNYPTRAEWNSAREKQADQLDTVKNDVSNMKLEQVRIGGAVNGIKDSQRRSESTQTEIRQKLDKVLEERLKRHR